MSTLLPTSLQDLGFHNFAWLAVIFASTAYILCSKPKRPIFPVVNAYPGDFTRRKAYTAYMQDARGLIAQELRNEAGPITLDTPSGPRIVLPSSLTAWVKGNKDLDHQELVYHDFFGNYPGFEANAMIHNPDNVVINTIRKKLSQNGRLVPIMSEHIGEALDELWTRDESWHEIDWVPSTMGLVSRAAASAFVGPRLAREPEWQEMTISYAGNFFAAAFELKRWPSWTRPFVHWFLPGARTCRKLVRDMRKAMRDEIVRRQQEELLGVDNENLDAIAWSQEIAGDTKVDHGAIQLAFAMAALFTTSEALRQVVLDICQHPALVKALREEITDALSTAGVTSAALAKMHLLDSVMKESQRLGPPAIVSLERQATRDTYLPDGTRLPRGSIVAVDSSDMWNPTIHSHPDEFDGYRFSAMREAGAAGTSFVSSTREHNVFGLGKHICPGRFLAAVEIKLCLAHILLKFDMELGEGYEPQTVKNGLFQMVDPKAHVRVRRRSGMSTFSIFSHSPVTH